MKKDKYIKHNCVGCGLCKAMGQADIVEDNNRFPVSNELKNEHWFENVCPVYYYSKECRQDVWGNVAGAYVGYSSDSDVRFKAASGGGITEICSYLLERNIVDVILHCTADPDNPTETINCVSENREQLVARVGSRYSISVPLENLQEFIGTGKKYAFVGKPCAVMALRNYLNEHIELQQQFPYLISFFCAGEPSKSAQEKLLLEFNCRQADLKSIVYRGNGWPGYTTIEDKKGIIKTMPYEKAWGIYLGRDIRRYCHFCMDGTGDAADIVCADFWQLNEENKPDFSEHEGRNIIITRNKKSDQLLKDLFETGGLVCEDDFTHRMDEFKFYQPHQYRRKITMKYLILVVKLMGRKYPRYNKLYLKTYAKHATFDDVKSTVIWSVKRILKRRI